MDFSPQQQDALSAAALWLTYPGGQQTFRLFGYAGTGKTTIAKALGDQATGTVYYVAYTGKAALVMSSKRCPATTIHSLIYLPKGKSSQRLRELRGQLAMAIKAAYAWRPSEKEKLLQQISDEEANARQPSFTLNHESKVKDAALIVVDEASMVGSRVGEDLASFGVPILALGDPAQLPPVKDKAFFMGHEPDVLLTDVHRQAEESPVIQLATDVREGRRPEQGEYGDSRVVQKGVLSWEDLASADQIIVGTNVTRRFINEGIRNLHGRTDPLPVPGDKLICTRNDAELGLMNGSLWEVVESRDNGLSQLSLIIWGWGDGRQTIVDVYKEPFLGEPAPSWASPGETAHFDYGNAITCHKAQGSEWDDVIVIDESRVFRQDARKWLYTAITRAAERVTVVL